MCFYYSRYPRGRAAEAGLWPRPGRWSALPPSLPGRASPRCRAPPGAGETNRPGARPGAQVGTTLSSLFMITGS